jgi:WD40 repeat protein
MAPFARSSSLVVNARARTQQALQALMFIAAAVNCGFPSPEACALACGAEGACPDGFECQAVSQLCVPLGTEAPCQPSGEFPARPDPSAAGGAGPAAGGSEAGAGAAGSAGSAGDGSGGATSGAGGGPAAGTLAIVDTSTSDPMSAVACTGVELTRSLRARDGVGPFEWRVLGAPAGVEVSGVDSDTLVVTGVPTEPGALEVELEDASGAVARSAELLVYESPQIANPALPAVCSGEPYEVQLVASGGLSDGYVWSAELVPEARLPESLGELGLAVSGSTLAGELDAAAEGLAPFQVALAVSDGRCRASLPAFDLDVVSPASNECPSIGVDNGRADPALAIDALPPPCLGNSYSESLTVEGGEPPYTWRALDAPAGLSFDAESATIEGVPEGDGVLTVELTDATFRTLRKRYDVQTRDKCWLAMIASEPSPAHLVLVDGRLLGRQPAAARWIAAPRSSSESVVDFAFSPDGRFIVYRLGPDPSALRLELLRLSDGELSTLDLRGSVAAYAWSPDGATLAVAVTADAQTQLGGIDLLAVPRAPLAGSLEGLRLLPARTAPSVDSELAWFDAGRLAFLSREAGASGRRRLVTTALGPAGFAAPTTRGTGDFSDGARLLVGVGGLFVGEPETGLHEFFAGDGRAPSTHAADLVLSPSGALGGLARGGGLEIFRPGDASGSAAAPFLRADGCTTLLAWASARERVACADANQVALFDVSAAPAASVAPLVRPPEPFRYPTGEHGGRRRLLSPSGRWFAFTTDSDLYVVGNDDGASRLAATLPVTALGIRPGALAFSPDEAFLLVGAGNSVAAFDLERGQSAPLMLSSSAIINDDCGERFVDGANQWCGSEPRASELAWSSGSDLVAFRSSLGTLELVDVSLASSGRIGDAFTPDDVCSEACRSAESARFQP